MQDLDLEISRINRLLPNVEIDVIKSFIISVPKTIEYLRVPLTLVHFFKLDNEDTMKLQNENLVYANLIHDLFPMYSVNKIMKKLTKYGNITERCRLVVRNILKSREQELNTALNQVSQSVFYIQFGKQGISADQNNDNCKEMCKENSDDTVTKANEELSVNPPGYTSYQESACDYKEPTSVFNDHLGLKDFSETVVTPSTSSEVEAPSFSKYFNITGNSEKQRTQFNKSPFQAYFEKHYSEGSSYRQQQQTYSYDSNQTCSGGFDDIDSALTDFKEQSDIGCERDHNKTLINSPVCRSPVTLGPLFDHSSNNVDKFPKPSPSDVTNIISFEEPIKVSSRKKCPSRSPPKGTELESSICDPARKKLKKSHYKNVENEEVLGDVILGSEDVILINSPSYEQQDADDIHTNIYLPHTFESEVQSNKMKKIGPTEKVNNKIIYRIMEIFPDADPDYIRQIYAEISHETSSEEVLHNILIEKILAVENYPKRPPTEPSTPVEFDLESQLQTIRELLPDADPNYLRMKVSQLPPEELTSFVDEALETKNYPTLKEYLRKQQLSAQKRQYTVDFSVEDFVKLVPNPKETFLDPNRKINVNQEDKDYGFIFFKNKFNRISVKNVLNTWQKSGYRPFDCNNSLEKLKEHLKYCRTKVDMSSLTCSNIPLLQELAFIEHEKEILSYIKDLEKKKEEERMRIKKEGLMLTCSCCFDDEVMPDYTHRCSNNCVFCKGCIIKSVEVAFGEGKLVFPCLGDCGSHFSLQNLQNVLPPNLFSKIAQKHAVAEVKAAGIEDLESCPFCDFATILSSSPETNKIFVCQNPECLKESCRLCKEPSHVPLRCDEVEKDDDVKKRVYIENKMTEALLRKCLKCGVSFYKEEGCNKMTCSCGASMCYICGQAVSDYKHFNGLGGEKYELCPLYSDTNAINKLNVIKGAEAAKEELGVKRSTQLKHDPTSDVQKHYEERAKQLPAEPHMEHLQMLNQMARAIANRDPLAAVPRQVPVVVRNPVRIIRHAPEIDPNNQRLILHARRATLPPQHRYNPRCPCEACELRRQ
ncbi:hypothetical protein WA026_016398 [Henosepilachna vigintioctopunctata]|uniref:RING-type domain-containing protein n=1 Tax=Henosepilachna vigintioctopunctata TaxID=420089 RepID=A0AAW1UJV5_9CUCU